MKKDDFIAFQDEISLACAMKDPKEQGIEFLDSDTPFTVELPPHSAKIYCIGNK